MRHGKKFNKLGKPADHRKALLRNLASSLFVHGYIRTTLAKAKALRPYAEKIVTKAIKVNKITATGARVAKIRDIFSDIKLEEAFDSVIKVWGVLCMGRPGGYIRIIKAGQRVGDNAEMAYIGIVLDGYSHTGKQFTDINWGHYRSIAIELLKQPLYSAQGVEQWASAVLPPIQVKPSINSAKNSLTFHITFGAIENAEQSAWPVYKGNKVHLPLSIRIDTLALKLQKTIAADGEKEIEREEYLPERLEFDYSFKTTGNIVMVPFKDDKNILSVRLLPRNEPQLLTGCIEVTNVDGGIKKVNSCELTIYSPLGKLASYDLLQLIKKTRRSK